MSAVVHIYKRLMEVCVPLLKRAPSANRVAFRGLTKSSGSFGPEGHFETICGNQEATKGTEPWLIDASGAPQLAAN